jgi:probable addiction module antidote protein
MSAFLVGENMSESSVRRPIRPTSSRREVADHINRAFKTSDITEICQAIGAAICQYNISDIANESRIGRPTVYRAFTRGPKHPNFKAVLSVLDAMGFQLHVSVRRNARARLAAPQGSSAPSTLIRSQNRTSLFESVEKGARCAAEGSSDSVSLVWQD